MIYSFLEDTLPTIATILTVIIIAVLVLITIFRKNDKKEVKLSLSKEKNANKINAKTYAIYRKSIQDYMIYLFDNGSNVILKSDLTNSILSSKNLFKEIKENIDENNFKICKSMEGLYYALLVKDNRAIARTLFYVTKQELEKTISTLVEINNSTELDETTYKNDSIENVDIKYEKKKSIPLLNKFNKKFKIIKIENEYYVALYDNNDIVFVSDPYSDNKIAKEYLNNFDVHYLGCIKQDRNMHIAVRQQTPLMMFSPMSTAAVELRRIVSEAFYELPEELKTKEKENEGFFKRLAKIFKGGKNNE